MLGRKLQININRRNKMHTLIISYGLLADKEDFLKENKNNLGGFYLIFAQSDTIQGINITCIRK